MADEVYIIMNKPRGYVCSAASDSHKTVYELLPQELQALVKNAKRGHRLHTIGRLDADTTGLLLLTTDGMFSHRIAAPGVPEPVEGPNKKHTITKTYLITLKNQVTPEEQAQYIVRASNGLILPPEKKAPEQKAAPAELHFTGPDTCKITVKEGKFHEVRRIFKALGNEVTALERLVIGNLVLPKDLQPGQYRTFDPGQIVF